MPISISSIAALKGPYRVDQDGRVQFLESCPSQVMGVDGECGHTRSLPGDTGRYASPCRYDGQTGRLRKCMGYPSAECAERTEDENR
jgi:hypothetical protein